MQSASTGVIGLCIYFALRPGAARLKLLQKAPWLQELHNALHHPNHWKHRLEASPSSPPSPVSVQVGCTVFITVFVIYEYHCSQAVASPARIGLRKRMNAMYRQLDLKASANLAPSMLVRLLMDDSYKLILSLIVFVPTSMHIPKQTLYCDCCHTAHSTCRRQTHPCEEGSRDCKLGAFGISETKVALPFSTPLLLYAAHFCDMSSAPSARHCTSLQLQFLRSSRIFGRQSLPVNLSVWSTLQRWSKWTTCQEGPMKFRFRQIEQQPAPRLDVVHREGRSLQSEQLNGNSTETGLNRPQDIPSFHQQT